MSKFTESVMEFHKAFGHPINQVIDKVSLKIRKLRIKLLFEELEELGLNREQLIEKLLEYKQYKDAANKLDNMQRQRTTFLTKEPDNMSDYRKKSFISS